MLCRAWKYHLEDVLLVTSGLELFQRARRLLKSKSAGLHGKQKLLRCSLISSLHLWTPVTQGWKTWLRFFITLMCHHLKVSAFRAINPGLIDFIHWWQSSSLGWEEKNVQDLWDQAWDSKELLSQHGVSRSLSVTQTDRLCGPEQVHLTIQRWILSFISFWAW